MSLSFVACLEGFKVQNYNASAMMAEIVDLQLDIRNIPLI